MKPSPSPLEYNEQRNKKVAARAFTSNNLFDGALTEMTSQI
jgi:hypothetical protein